MEPVTITAMIGTVVGYLAKHKSVNDFFNDFTAASVNWIRPLFLKDENQYEKIIEDLMKKPDSTIKQQQVEIAIASHLEDNPTDAQHLIAMYEAIKKSGNKFKATDLKAAGDIQATVKQEGESEALFDKFDSGGKITIDINQK